MAGKGFYKSNTAYFFVLELASAFVLSAAHNVLFFVLDIKLIATSFAQFLFTFLFLKAAQFVNFLPSSQISQKELIFAAGGKTLEVLIASFANSHNRTGELYLIRCFDFLYAGMILIYYTAQVTGKSVSKLDCWLITPLIVFGSISWFEPGQIEYTYVSLLASFILPFARALSFILLRKAMETSGHMNTFILDYTRMVTILLFVPAMSSYSRNTVEVTASWESIDYVLMALSFVFMICNLYSQLWLTLTLNPNMYLTMETSRNLFASCAQWIIQNMAHPNLIAFGAKIVTFSSIFRLWTRYSS